METLPAVSLHDEEFSKIFESENRSVSRFFDAVFGFFSRNSPEIIFDASKHYGKQLLLSNYEKWQNKFLKENNSHTSSSKRAKNDFSQKDKEDCLEEVCWMNAPNPGGPTNTTSTATFSSKRSNSYDTSITESKKEEKYDLQKYAYFDTTNGAHFDNYGWTQSIDDIDLRIPVCTSVIKGNQVNIIIEKKYLKVEVCGNNGEFMSILEGELLNSVRGDDCVWLLYPGQHIAILLQKLEEKWWDRCLINEYPIDLKKINTERPYYSLPEEEKRQIEKVLLEKQQKERNLPTSSQEKMESLLRKAWDAEGSPFKDQPFDPSLINIVNSSS